MRNNSHPTIAISNRMFFLTQDLINYALKTNCGIDYSFEAQNLSDLKQEAVYIEKIAREDLDIRYHCPFKSIEFAHVDKNTADYSLQYLRDCVDVAGSFGGKYLTTHIGLGFKSPNNIDYENAVVNLSKLVDYGDKKGITVCLENLTTGWTNNPRAFLELIEKTGASVTFDLGHANSCPSVIENQCTSVEFLRTVDSYLINAHVYEIEKIDEKTLEPYHVAPQNLDIIRPLLLELINNTKCDWWVIELRDQEEVKHTRYLLESFLDEI
ncbi:MAG: hypothetical protein CVV03_00380 [Firmicutes bacterium HGW-Firmicutes-8]|nr:MAG: hypothetical protein CVV03_00380 [Firmicutes bacterium HGW-Firmicutes-8]